MGAERAVVVTGFNHRHFDLAEDMADSYRAAYGDRYALAAAVYGGVEAPPQLRAKFDLVVDVSDLGPGYDESLGYFFAYSGLKARLPDIFPGFSMYAWVDADCWFQGSESLPRILNGAVQREISIHPEYDIHYTHSPTPGDRTLKIYQQNEARHIDTMPLRMPMVNAGVYAMRPESRVWKMWNAELIQLKLRHDRGEDVYFSDQIPLHKLIYRHGIQFSPLRAIDNWMAIFCMPMLHKATKCLRAPTLPHEMIGILHLAGKNFENKVFQIDGHAITLRYRDLMPVLSA